MFKWVIIPLFTIIIILCVAAGIIGLCYLLNGKDWDKTFRWIEKVVNTESFIKLKNKIIKCGDRLLCFLNLEDEKK